MSTPDLVPNTSPIAARLVPPLPLAPGRVGLRDVERIEDTTRAFRALDYQYGGGACHDAVVSYLPWGVRMLAGDATSQVMDRLCVAVADLHNLAAWTSFDIGQVGVARTYFSRALELAERGGDDALVANIWYRMGRVHLHHDAPGKALAEFQRGQVAAQACGSALAVAILCGNQAWAYAKMGLDDQALALLGRSSDEFARAEAEAPPWATFFTETDMSAMVGTVYTELALTADPAYTRSAIPALATAINGYAAEMNRSRSFNLIALATNHLLDNEIDHAATVGAQAVAACESVKTARTKERYGRFSVRPTNGGTTPTPAHCPSGSPPSLPPNPAVAGPTRDHRSPARRAAARPARGYGARRYPPTHQPEPHRQERSQLLGPSSPSTGVGRP